MGNITSVGIGLIITGAVLAAFALLVSLFFVTTPWAIRTARFLIGLGLILLLVGLLLRFI